MPPPHTDEVAWPGFCLPADVPWFCDEAVRSRGLVETGNTRRPIMQPPPSHVRVEPPGLEFAVDDINGDLRQRLEAHVQKVLPRADCGQIVYEDLCPYRASDDDGPDRERILQFESRFESGNLQRAVRVGPNEYDLFLRPDKSINSTANVQWYYFMVRNMRNGVPYVFNIVNFVKPKSLYNAGLRPLLYSEKEARGRRSGVGWHRAGSNVAYCRRGNRYALSFTMSFKYEGDTCFLAHCYPYTYTDCQMFLSDLVNDPIRKEFCRRSVLCRSFAGNVVDLVEISEGVHDENSPAEPKPSILLSARVHPGETQGSWAIQSCLEFLTSSLPEAKLLRSHYTLYVIPMLNPDGVINGHYRCSLSGNDLNRVWANPDKIKHPCIWHTRNLVQILSSQGLRFFCDFHGHSVKKNAFMYGCSSLSNSACKPSSTKAIPPTAMFPLLLEEISPAFSFFDCNFRVHKSKMNTGRVVVNREFGVLNSYTIEISFLGHQVGGSIVHFKIEDLQKIGKDFAIALIKYHLPTQFEITQMSSASSPTPVQQRALELRRYADVGKMKAPGSSKTQAKEGWTHKSSTKNNLTLLNQKLLENNVLPEEGHTPLPGLQLHVRQDIAPVKDDVLFQDVQHNFIRAAGIGQEVDADRQKSTAMGDQSNGSKPTFGEDTVPVSAEELFVFSARNSIRIQTNSIESSTGLLSSLSTCEHDACEGDETSEDSSDDDESATSDDDCDSKLVEDAEPMLGTERDVQSAFRDTMPATATEILENCDRACLPAVKVRSLNSVSPVRDSPDSNPLAIRGGDREGKSRRAQHPNADSRPSSSSQSDRFFRHTNGNIAIAVNCHASEAHAYVSPSARRHVQQRLQRPEDRGPVEFELKGRRTESRREVATAAPAAIAESNVGHPDAFYVHNCLQNGAQKCKDGPALSLRKDANVLEHERAESFSVTGGSPGLEHSCNVVIVGRNQNNSIAATAAPLSDQEPNSRRRSRKFNATRETVRVRQERQAEHFEQREQDFFIGSAQSASALGFETSNSSGAPKQTRTTKEAQVVARTTVSGSQKAPDYVAKLARHLIGTDDKEQSSPIAEWRVHGYREKQIEIDYRYLESKGSSRSARFIAASAPDQAGNRLDTASHHFGKQTDLDASRLDAASKHLGSTPREPCSSKASVIAEARGDATTRMRQMQTYSNAQGRHRLARQMLLAGEDRLRQRRNARPETQYSKGDLHRRGDRMDRFDDFHPGAGALGEGLSVISRCIDVAAEDPWGVHASAVSRQSVHALLSARRDPDNARNLAENCDHAARWSQEVHDRHAHAGGAATRRRDPSTAFQQSWGGSDISLHDQLLPMMAPTLIKQSSEPFVAGFGTGGEGWSKKRR